jgi:hypothetical protein
VVQVINNMAHTEKPLFFIDEDVDCREKLDQFDPPSDSNGTFREFWREYKEKTWRSLNVSRKTASCGFIDSAGLSVEPESPSSRVTSSRSTYPQRIFASGFLCHGTRNVR